MDVAFGVEAGTHGDHVGMNVEYVRNYLRCRCLMPLPLRTRSHRDYHFSVNIKLAVCALRIAGEGRVGIDDLRLAKVVGSGIEGRPDAKADQAAFFAGISLLFLPVVPSDEAF